MDRDWLSKSTGSTSKHTRTHTLSHSHTLSHTHTHTHTHTHIHTKCMCIPMSALLSLLQAFYPVVNDNLSVKTGDWLVSPLPGFFPPLPPMVLPTTLHLCPFHLSFYLLSPGIKMCLQHIGQVPRHPNGVSASLEYLHLCLLSCRAIDTQQHIH